MAKSTTSSQREWSSKILISFWVVQMILEFIAILLLTALIADELGSLNILSSADIVFLTFVCLSLVLEPLTMFLRSHLMLKPWLYLGFQVCKALFATVFWVYELSRFVKEHTIPIFPLNSEKAAFLLLLIVNVAVGGVMALSFYASLAYGVVVLRGGHRVPINDNFVKEQDSFLEK